MNKYEIVDGLGVSREVSASYFKVEGEYIVFYVSTLFVGALEDITTHKPVYLCSNILEVILLEDKDMASFFDEVLKRQVTNHET